MKRNEIIRHLQEYLLGLDKGFSFVAASKRILVDGNQFYIDLVFYNYILKCFVLVDLKNGNLSPDALEQMKMYVDFYTREMMNEGDNLPIGMVICADKNDATIKYILPKGNTQNFVSRYMTYIPSEEEFKRDFDWRNMEI
ncbi:MAG: PDDEXK nuclease domain-containing protein [Huintestinicola sp.]